MLSDYCATSVGAGKDSVRLIAPHLALLANPCRSHSSQFGPLTFRSILQMGTTALISAELTTIAEREQLLILDPIAAVLNTCQNPLNAVNGPAFNCLNVAAQGGVLPAP